METIIGCYKLNWENSFFKDRQLSIYQCTNTDTNFKCCAQILNKKDQSDNIDRYSFEQEKKVFEQLKWLRHDNILTLYDYKVQGDLIYQFSELFDETIVEQMKPEFHFTKLQFFDLISQVSLGYMELKQLNIIHRDLKPEKIVIKKQGTQIKYKISDFRMSRIIDDSQSLFTKNIGTQKYSSPEILLDKKNYSYESDIFSFGLILYEIAGGNLEVIENQQNEFFEALKVKGFKQYCIESQAQNNLLEEILSILDKIIVYDPKKRYTWENLNNFTTEKLREFHSFSQPISVGGQNGNLGQLNENFNSQNMLPIQFKAQNNQLQFKQDNNQIFNNVNFSFNRQHVRTESDMQFLQPQPVTQRYQGQNIQEENLQKIQNQCVQNQIKNLNGQKYLRINFPTMK